YFHPFGTYGKPFDTVAVHQFWLQQERLGTVTSLDPYCMAWTLAEQRRFAPPARDPRSVLSTYDYAYHFDAARYAAFL
ncbi:tryptophan 7-halogenase, partial [Streptomyces niveiscabiei]|uniref:tryptophan 7-halogenase n=1 Tax=Streptomyces niveiscabiei TaxID=164115 RepID=UPI0038F743E3